jgi:phosphonate transport system permease protein
MNTISHRLSWCQRYEKSLLLLVLLTPLTLGACWVCGVRWGELWRGIGESFHFVSRMRPEWDAFGEMWEPALQSVLIAVVSTLAGTVLSILFAFFAAANIAPRWLRNSVRAVLGMERALPEIVILLFLVAAFGMGSFSGVMALTIGSIGMLGKLIADAIEELDPMTIESIEAIGATKMQLLVFGVVQQIMPSIISFALFRFELSIRLSVVLGAVGAGGIGLEMYRAFFLLDYPRATTALIVILGLVFVTERMSEFLRKKIKGAEALK